MQKGKGLYRCGGGVGGGTVSIVLLCMLWVAGAADRSEAECAARALAGCSRGIASRALPVDGAREAKNGAGFRATISNPYLIDGLIGSDLLVGFESGSISAWIDWRRLGHELYREDRFSAVVGLPSIVASSIRLYAIPVVERRAVRGFEAVGRRAVWVGCSGDLGGGACAGVVFRAFGSAGAEREHARIFLLMRTRSLEMAVDGAVSGPRGSDAQCALAVWLAEALALTAAYRRQTGEMTSGIAVRVSRAMLEFTWSWHPALGSTASVGVGRSWRW